MNFIKSNKKRLFLMLCFSCFSLMGFTNNKLKDNNFLKNLKDSSIHKTKNNFNVNLQKNAAGFFDSVSYNTGWKLLLRDENISILVKKYRYFNLPLSLQNYYFGLVGWKYFQNFTHDDFETCKYLINNQVTQKEYYGEKIDGFGYMQQYVIISFKLVGNDLYFMEYGHVYSGWCFTVSNDFVNSDLKANDKVVFYN